MAYRKIFSTPRYFKLKGDSNRGLDLEDAIQALWKCGFPYIDAETGACGTLSIVNGNLVIDGDLSTIESYCIYTYTIPNPASPASDTLTVSGLPEDDFSVNIDGQGYTWRDSPAGFGNTGVLIGANAEESIDNLVAAINGDAGAGTLYSASITTNPTVVAAKTSASTMTVTTYNLFGAPADAIAVFETHGNTSWGDGDADGTLVLEAATVDLGVDGNTLTSTPYEITSSGVSDKSVNLLASEIADQLNSGGVFPAGVSASVSGTNYVVQVTIDSANAAALEALDIERDGTPIDPTNNC